MVRNFLSSSSVVVALLSLFLSLGIDNLATKAFSTRAITTRRINYSSFSLSKVKQQRLIKTKNKLKKSTLKEISSSFLFMSSTSINKEGDIDECIIVEEDPTSPAKEFGSPLNDAARDFNRQMIMKIKETIFDTFYPQSTSIERNYARFYALETIARMPYFSYLSVLHLFETLGYWRRAEYMKIHFSESWNELHHLLIMEELGSAPCRTTSTKTTTTNTTTTTTDKNDHVITFVDKFIAQHIAVLYYWLVVVFYLANPNFAYNLNQAVEEEAYATYDEFLNTYEHYLRNQPAPKIALQYYLGDDHYLYDNMHWNSESYIDPSLPLSQSSQGKKDTQPEPCIINESDIIRRRPKINNLYDVFVAIRDDEMEHAKTMAFMQQKS